MQQDNSYRMDVRDFGAAGDRSGDAGPAIQRALDAAGEADGGVVEVPPGDYLIGGLEMRARVTLYLHAGATLWAASAGPGSASRSRGIDSELYRLGGIIYAENADDFAIRGQGRIDGNGLSYTQNVNGRNVIPRGTRRPHMLLFINCHNVLLEDIQLTDSPTWTIHPIDCDRMIIRGISIINGINKEKPGVESDHVPNADGIDPDGCTNMRISDCYIQAGDDSIVLKNSPRSKRQVCSNITVTNCVLVSTETALKIGSQTDGEFRNIVFSNCAVRDAGCGVGLWMRDGGVIDGWMVSNIAMTLPFNGVAVYMSSWPRDEETRIGEVRNVMIRDVIAECEGAVFLSGMNEAPLRGVTLENFRLLVRGSERERYHADPPYPFQVWGHRRSPYDIYCRHVSDLKLRNIRLQWASPENPDWGSAIRCEGIENLEIAGFEGRQTRGSDRPVIHLRDVRQGLIHGCRPAEEAGVFVHLDRGCGEISLIGNDLSRAAGAMSRAAEVNAWTIFETANRPPA